MEFSTNSKLFTLCLLTGGRWRHPPERGNSSFLPSVLFAGASRNKILGCKLHRSSRKLLPGSRENCYRVVATGYVQYGREGSYGSIKFTQARLPTGEKLVFFRKKGVVQKALSPRRNPKNRLLSSWPATGGDEISYPPQRTYILGSKDQRLLITQEVEKKTI